MKNINTIILCSCGTKINIIIGYIKSLIDNNIIDSNYNNLDTVIGCSAGSIIGFYILLNMSPSIMLNLSLKINYENMINLNDLNLSNIFENNGLFDIKYIERNLKKILKIYNFDKNITLLEFYKKTKKEFIIKTVNITKKKSEYISYKNYPNLEVTKAICMSSCIPIFFKNIIYNDNIYIDGGVTGGLPILKKYKKYIGIYIYNNYDNTEIINDSYKFLQELTDFGNYQIHSDIYNNINILKIETKGGGINFSISKEQKYDDFLLGYKSTNKFIIEHK